MSSWYGILELCSDLIEAWLCYEFTGIFLPDRVRKKLPVFLLSMTLVCSVRVMGAWEVDPLVTTLWFLFFICVSTCVLYQADLFDTVSLVSFYFLCLYIINYFCISVMGVIAGNRQFASFILNQLSLLRCAYLAANKIILFLFYLLAHKAFRGKQFYNPYMIFTVSFFGILGVVFLSAFTLQEISVLTLFSWGLFLVILLCFCLIMLFYASYRKELEMRGILEFKAQTVRQEYEMIRQIQIEQETLSHNMNNHILILDSMLKEGQTSDACAYISQLRTSIDHLSPAIWTGTPTLDVLLNHTGNRSHQAGIRFIVQADALDFHSMEEQDICSLFANLLDNAYEAAARMPEGQGWIHVKIRKVKHMVFIDISNSSPNAPCRRNGRLMSGKENRLLHGIGLNSAAMTAKRYGGQLDYEYKDHVFSVIISFLGTIHRNSGSSQ